MAVNKNNCDKSYTYIKDELLGWRDKTSRFLFMRLRGLMTGNYYYRKSQPVKATYTDEQIYLTCKLHAGSIKNWLSKNSAKLSNEQAIINSILAFVANNINDVVAKLEIARKAQDLSDKVELTPSTELEYASITDDRQLSKEIEDIW